MRVCIICIQKNEENYINEWIDWHLRLGIDKIFICNNDDTGDDRLYSIINNENVQVIDYQSVNGVQPIAYTAEFKRLRNQFDWLIFIDIDEFIVLEGFSSIKEFLSLPQFKDCDSIKMNMKIFDDDGILDVVDDDYSVVNRFKHSIEHERNHWMKSIIRGSVDIGENKINGHGYYYGGDNYVSVNVLGTRIKNHHFLNTKDPIVHSLCWINHYPTKSIGEYVRQKYFRGGANQNPDTYSTLSHFWKYNKKTEEKEKYGIKLIDEMQAKGFSIRKRRVYRDKTGRLVINK